MYELTVNAEGAVAEIVVAVFVLEDDSVVTKEVKHANVLYMYLVLNLFILFIS